MDELNYVEWMTSLPQSLREIPIINLAIPGSHNSMTYGINSESELAADAEQTVKYLYHVVPCFVRRWAKTQRIDATKQLEIGVRYFDLRVCTHNDKFYYTHALFAMEVFEGLQQIRTFLDAHAGEVVIIDFQHFYDMKVAQHMQLQALLLDFFAHRLYSTTDGPLKACTLNYCAQLGRQVIIIYRRYAVNLPQQFWYSSAWPTPWPNCSSATELVQFLNNALMTRRTTQGYVSQCVLTPSGRYIALRCLSSLRRTAKKVDKKVKPWLEQQTPGPFENKDAPRINVIIADFVDIKDAEFCKMVIGLNKRIMEQLQQTMLNNTILYDEDNSIEMFNNEREI